MVTSFPDEIRHLLVDEIYRSRKMISTLERIAAQGKLSPEEASCLSEEKRRRDVFQRNLRTKITVLYKQAPFQLKLRGAGWRPPVVGRLFVCVGKLYHFAVVVGPSQESDASR